MKAFVISMMDNSESLRVARRCIKSAAKFGVVMGHFSAITPKKDPEQIAASKGIPIKDSKKSIRGLKTVCLRSYHIILCGKSA